MSATEPAFWSGFFQWFATDWRTLVSFAAMTAATYACRGGGYWLFRQVTPSPFVRSMLAFIPGTLFVSFVVPAVMKGGPMYVFGAVVTIGAMLLTRSILASLIVGIGAVWGVSLL